MGRRFARLRKRVKADPGCVLYSYRHTSITDSLVADMEIATVAELHGTSVRMIEANYGHLCRHKDHLLRAARSVAKFRNSADGSA